jgi:hypothetical protein
VFSVFLDQSLRRSVALGTAITACLLLIAPVAYFAPIAGGLLAGFSVRGPRGGFRAGLLLGIAILPIGVVLTCLSVFFATPGTGIDLLVLAMDGMGTRSIVFYAVVIYFLGVYTVIAGGISGLVGGTLSRLFVDAPGASRTASGER